MALYDQLCRLEDRTGDLSHDEHAIRWRFHESLSLLIRIDDLEGYIDVNHGLTHWHPEKEEVYDELCAILRGEVVFVSEIGLTGRYMSGVYKRDYFDRHRKRLKFGVGVRCVTSRGIIP